MHKNIGRERWRNRARRKLRLCYLGPYIFLVPLIHKLLFHNGHEKQDFYLCEKCSLKGSGLVQSYQANMDPGLRKMSSHNLGTDTYYLVVSLFGFSPQLLNQQKEAGFARDSKRER